MTRAFKLAFAQLGDKSFRRVIWIGIIGSAVIFALLWTVVGYLLFNTSLFALDGWLSFLNDWLEGVSDALGTALVVFLSWLLFPSVVTLIVSFYLEATAQAVEDKHYPHLPETRGQPISEVLMVTVKFSLLAIFLNILALPVYAVLFFIGPFNLFVFYALNGYLLGREFFELVAHRRLDPRGALYLRSAFRGQLFLAGVVIAFMMTIPILNLLASVIATAALVHLVQGWRTRLEASEGA